MAKPKSKYLFVCSANIYRSRTAEHFFKEQMTGTPYEFKSCGTYVEWIAENKDDYAKDSVPISRDLVEWADVILCMENEHGDYIAETFGDDIRAKAFVLGIPDIFGYRSSDLEAILLNKVKFNL